MRTFSDKDEIYIGKDAGTELLQSIKNAKASVKIVSPYLSAAYIKELFYLHKKGVKITLITCDKLIDNSSSSYSDFSAFDLIEKKKIQNKNFSRQSGARIISFFIFLALLVMAFSLSIFFQLFLYLSFVLLIISLVILVSIFKIKQCITGYVPIFRIKVFDSSSGQKPYSTELIHSKIFVIDDNVAYLGSMNFTYCGFKKHYETIIKISSQNAVKDISREVEDLYNSKILREKPPKEWM